LQIKGCLGIQCIFLFHNIMWVFILQISQSISPCNDSKKNGETNKYKGFIMVYYYDCV